jgi:hypothetical protein
MIMTTITEVKLAFAQATDGRMTSVDEVARGLACGCSCPDCRRRVIAVKGNIVRHHFRHARAEGVCAVTPESVIHKYAKQLICEKRFLRLPDELGRMLRATPECSIANIRPDVYAEYQIEPVAIEIFVAHKADDAKVQSYNELRLAAVEIDLSDYREIDQGAKDWDMLILVEAHREWLSPPAEIRRQREEAAAETQRIEHARRVELERRRTLALLERVRREEEEAARNAEQARRNAEAEAQRAEEHWAEQRHARWEDFKRRREAEMQDLISQNPVLTAAKDAIRRGLQFEFIASRAPYIDIAR